MGAAFFARAQVTKHSEWINTGFMMIGETDVERVVSNEIDLQPFDVARNRIGIEQTFTRNFTSTSGTAAVLSQVAKGVRTRVTILPPDSELLLPLFLQFYRSGRIYFHSSTISSGFML
jgi:hypothetical protein